MMLPCFLGDHSLLLFVGPDPFGMDLFAFTMLGADQIFADPVLNLSGTSGESAEPFALAGTLEPGMTFRNRRGSQLYIQLLGANPGLAAVDTGDRSICSVIGNHFSAGLMIAMDFITRITSRRVGDEERSVLHGMDSTGAPFLMAFDANDPCSSAQVMSMLTPAESISDVRIRRDGEQVVWAESDAAQTEIMEASWLSSANLAATLPGQLIDGSMRFVHHLDPTLIYGYGTNDPINPTDAVLEHLSLRSGTRIPVTSTGSEHRIPRGRPRAAPRHDHGLRVHAWR